MTGTLTAAQRAAAAASVGPVLPHPPGPQAQQQQRARAGTAGRTSSPRRARSVRRRPRVSRGPRPACPRESSATAYRSQLIVAGQRQRRRDGEHRGVPRASPGEQSGRRHGDPPQHSASPSALMSKYHLVRFAASSDDGTSLADSHIAAPVSTGYSTCCSRLLPDVGTSPVSQAAAVVQRRDVAVAGVGVDARRAPRVVAAPVLLHQTDPAGEEGQRQQHPQRRPPRAGRRRAPTRAARRRPRCPPYDGVVARRRGRSSSRVITR